MQWGWVSSTKQAKENKKECSRQEIHNERTEQSLTCDARVFVCVHSKKVRGRERERESAIASAAVDTTHLSISAGPSALWLLHQLVALSTLTGVAPANRTDESRDIIVCVCVYGAPTLSVFPFFKRLATSNTKELSFFVLRKASVPTLAVLYTHNPSTS